MMTQHDELMLTELSQRCSDQLDMIGSDLRRVEVHLRDLHTTLEQFLNHIVDVLDRSDRR